MWTQIYLIYEHSPATYGPKSLVYNIHAAGESEVWVWPDVEKLATEQSNNDRQTEFTQQLNLSSLLAGSIYEHVVFCNILVILRVFRVQES